MRPFGVRRFSAAFFVFVFLLVVYWASKQGCRGGSERGREGERKKRRKSAALQGPRLNLAIRPALRYNPGVIKKTLLAESHHVGTFRQLYEELKNHACKFIRQQTRRWLGKYFAAEK
jgi:hypothetical protein